MLKLERKEFKKSAIEFKEKKFKFETDSLERVGATFNPSLTIKESEIDYLFLLSESSNTMQVRELN